MNATSTYARDPGPGKGFWAVDGAACPQVIWLVRRSGQFESWAKPCARLYCQTCNPKAARMFAARMRAVWDGAPVYRMVRPLGGKKHRRAVAQLRRHQSVEAVIVDPQFTSDGDSFIYASEPLTYYNKPLPGTWLSSAEAAVEIERLLYFTMVMPRPSKGWRRVVRKDPRPQTAWSVGTNRTEAQIEAARPLADERFRTRYGRDIDWTRAPADEIAVWAAFMRGRDDDESEDGSDDESQDEDD